MDQQLTATQTQVLEDHTCASLEDFAIKTLSQINDEDKNEEIARVRKNTIALQYYRGQQRGFFDNGDWQPLDWTLEKDSRIQATLLSDNIYRPQIKALIKEWSRSRTEMKTRSRNNSRRKVAAARFASQVIALYQDKIMNESFRQQEGRWAVLTGNYFRYTSIHKDGKHSPKVRVPQTEQREVIPESYRCTNEACGEEFPVDQPQSVCQVCGAQIEHQEAVHAEVPVGYEHVAVGEPHTILVDPRTVKIPLSTRNLRDHSYLRWERMDELTRLRRKYRDKTLVGTSTSELSRYVIETERSSGASDTALYGAFNMSNNRASETYLWLKPDYYFGVVFDEDQVVGDFVVKANQPMDDQFPFGILLQVIGTRLMAASEQDLADCWDHGTYDELAETPYGDGNDDAVLDQNRYNELRAMQMENALFNSFQKLVIDTKYIDPTLIENNAEMIPLNQNAGLEGNMKGRAFDVIPCTELSNSIPELVMSVESSMRAKTAAHLAMSGEGDPSQDTATGMSILRDAAVATLGLALALRSEVDVEWAYQTLEFLQQNWVDEYHSKMCGDYSKEEAKAFIECDVRNDLEITVQANSWIPRTEEQIRMDFEKYLTAGGLPLGFANPELPVEVQQAAEDIYRVPLEMSKIHPDMRIAGQRLDKLMAMGEELPRPHEDEELANDDGEEIAAGYQQAAMILAGKIPVRPYVDDHAIITRCYTAWLKTDEGELAHPIIQDAVQILIQRHRDAARQLQGEAQSEAVEDQGVAVQAQAQQQAQAAATTGAAVGGDNKTGEPTAVTPEMPSFEQGRGQNEGAVAVPQ